MSMSSAAGQSPRFLFVPTSGPFGMGEYFQSLGIAQASLRRWPGAAIHFLLSREAPYAAAAPFDSTLLPSSPTFNTRAVISAIDTFRPDVAIFANAGRRAQFLAARRAGAAVVFISYRRRKRFKATRLRWLRLIDEHWIAFPRFIAGGPMPFETLKLRLLGKPPARYLDIVLPPMDGAGHASPLLDLTSSGPPVLVVPGGGAAPPNAPDAPTRFRAAAVMLAEAGVHTVYVGPGDGARPAALRAYTFLPQRDLFELMRAARLVITNGGQTMLQALACGAPCVAAPIARDQPIRVRRAAAAGVAVAAPLDTAAITRAARSLLDDEASRTALARRVAALSMADGATVAVDALAGLLDQRRRSRAE